MKRNLLLLIACLMGSVSVLMAQSPIVGVSHEVIYDSDAATTDGLTGYPENSQTYRVYSMLENSTSVMQSCIGVPGFLDLTIGTDNGNVWNYTGPTGGTLGEDIAQLFIDFGIADDWALYDSYVTIGSHTDSDPAGQTSVNAWAGVAGLDYNIAEGVFWGQAPYDNPGEPLWIANNSGWLLGDVSGANAYGVGPDFKVTLAQITTTGEVAYCLNVSALTDLPTNGGQTYLYYWDAAGLGGTSFNEVDGSGLGLKFPADVAVPGCTDNAACNFNADATEDDGSCVYPGCDDLTACNFDVEAGCDDGSCTYPGCTNAEADNYNPDAGCDDGSCVLSGCTDIDACNYDDTANNNDGSCTFPGCLDTTACNLDPNAGCEDNTQCTYPGCTDAGANNYDPTAGCDDGSCTFDTIGCTNPEACNYNPEATVSDDSCTFPGCNDSAACNYDSTAGCNDDSCTYPGCSNPDACNYDETAGCDDGSCDFDLQWFIPEVVNGGVAVLACSAPDGYILGDQDCVQEVVDNDSFCIETNWDSICQDAYDCCVNGSNGCTNESACNYDPEADCDDDSCLFPFGGDLVTSTDPIEVNVDDFGGDQNQIDDIITCAGDGEADLVYAEAFGWEGDDQVFVITTEDLEILAIVEEFPFDFEPAEPGVCLIWSIASFGELTGLEVGLNAEGVEGCYSVSGPGAIVRQEAGCMDQTATNYNPNAECPADCDYDTDCDLVCPDDVTVECGDDSSPESTGWPYYTPGCFIPTFNGDDIFFEYTDEVSGDGCESIIVRTFYGFEGLTCTQTITVLDTTAPYFLIEPADLTVECEEDVPAAEECIAEDLCNDWFTEVFETETGGPGENCDLTTAMGPGDDWAIWLPALYTAGVAPSAYWHFDGNGLLETFDDSGSAHISGTIYNSIDPTLTFEVDFWFENKADWDAWSALGRSYKDDMGLATPGMLYESWDYYEMVGGFSTLTGTGALAGSSLAFYHHPASYYFGFQCGEAANNKNANEGFSGWFTYNGTVDGVSIAGNGDINVDKECSFRDVDCINDTEYTYMWRAEDDCGNATIIDQVITVDDTTAPEFYDAPADLTLECDQWPVPVDENIYAEDNCACGLNEDNGFVYVGEFLIEGDGSGCNDLYARRWEATDCCGNTSEYVQSIQVLDTTPPVFTSVPADMTLECDQDIPSEDATATDNCSTPEVVMVELEEGDSCDRTITRTYTATDACGLTATHVQTIHIVDTTAPVFDPFEIQIYVNCEDVIDVPELTATDNCNDFEVTYTETFNSGGCMGVYHRIYTAVDICGNSSTAEQFITVLDNEPPVINNPEDMTVECDDVPSTPEEGDILITDNCALDIEVEFTETITEGPCADSYTITWYWYAEDYCGNWSEATTVINVVDTTDPTWVEETLPQDLTIECDQDIPAVVLPEAEDNCDEDVAVEMTSETEEDGDCPYNYVITRIFRGTDNCGNEVLYAQTITVQDTTPPTLEVPGDIVLECPAEVPAPSYDAFDNCGNVTVECTDVESGDSCVTVITRTCVATDECNNSTTEVYTITIADTTAPTVEAAADLTIECDQEVPAADYTYSDNCNEGTVDVVETINDEDWCNVYITRTYTPTDICGNVGEADVQVIHVVDTTAPVFDPFPGEIDVPCDDVEIPTVTATDNCHTPEITFEDQVFSGNCADNIVRTYYAEDMCGNVSTAVQIIQLIDETPPYFIDFPADVTVECSDDIPGADDVEQGITYGDNCSEEVDLEYNGSVTNDGSCPQDYYIEHTWTVIDECNLEATMTWTVHVQDTTPPELYVPEDIVLECPAEVPAPSYDAFDNCGNVTVECTDVESGDSCVTVITRTCVATDECNNSTTEVYTITIADTTAPTVEAAADLTIECDQEVPAADYTYSDNCNEGTVDVVETINDEDWCNVYITRTYTPTDICGNVGEADVQVIHVVDTTAPVFDPFPGEIDVPCDDADIPTVTATDNCHTPEITFEDQVFSGNCADNIVRTYYAEDMCGNVSTAVQIIQLIDETPPYFIDFPADVTVECSDDIPGADDVEQGITYGDNCSEEVDLEYNGSVTNDGSCPQDYYIEHTWTVIDECNLEATMTWTVHVQDTTPPTLEVPGDISLECPAEVPAPSYDAFDNCGNVTVECTDVESGDSCVTVITRTCVATDECNNSTTEVYTITIADTTAPTVEVAADATIECTEPLPAADYTYSDNCNEGTVDVTETTNDEDPCNVYVTRTYTPTDICGNVGEAVVQVIHIVDTTPPSVIPAADITIDCNDEIPAPSYTTEDNCSSVTVEITPVVTGDGCDMTMVRTYVPTDACGNVGEGVTQTIHIVDTTPPTVSVDADITIDCGDDVPETNYTYSDDCNEGTVELGETIEGDNCDRTITRTFTPIDACGNVGETVTQVIHQVDTTPPTVSVGDSMTIDCGSEVPAPSYEYADDCNEGSVDVEEVTTGDSCNMTITRTYTPTDACGNVGESAIQVIQIVDTTAPVLTINPDVTINCDDEIGVYFGATATDDCNTAIITSSEAVFGENDYCYTIEITYYAEDNCGNEADPQVQIINVIDNEAPVIVTPPSNVTVQCADDVPAFSDWEVVDNCDPNPTVETFEDYLEGPDDCGNYVKLVTCSAYDACGNQSETVTFTVTVEDTMAPEFNEEIPTEIVLDCLDEVPAFEDCTATDNCDEDVFVDSYEEIIGDLPNPDALNECMLLNPTDQCDLYDFPWALLFTDGYLDDNEEYQYYTLVEGTWLDFEGGTASLTATVVSVNNPEAGFYINVNFENMLTYDEWISQEFPTGTKSDCYDSEGLEQDWLFYIMSEGATLEGWGDFDGSFLSISHAPSNYYYGYQVGMGANNQTPNYGSGGWFSYEGTFVDSSNDVNVAVEGAGDFSLERNCCPQYYIERTWCAIDCSGNETCITQTITFEGDGIPVPPSVETEAEGVVTAIKGDFEIIAVTPNPTATKTRIEFVSNSDNKLVLEVYDMTGRVVDVLFSGDVQANTRYTHDYVVNSLESGMYNIRLRSNNEQVVEKLMISK